MCNMTHSFTCVQPKHSDGMVLGASLHFLAAQSFALSQPASLLLQAYQRGATVRINPMVAIQVSTHCNTLQHTATHCNTLQHTATHCSTLQHTATHCNALQHTATHCNTLQHTAAHCNTLHHQAMAARVLQVDQITTGSK